MHFQFRAMANKSGMKIPVQVFIWIYVFIYLREILRSAVNGHIVGVCLTF